MIEHDYSGSDNDAGGGDTNNDDGGYDDDGEHDDSGGDCDGQAFKGFAAQCLLSCKVTSHTHTLKQLIFPPGVLVRLMMMMI